MEKYSYCLKEHKRYNVEFELKKTTSWNDMPAQETGN